MLLIKLNPTILVQEQFNGDMALLDPESLPESYWIASGLAADIIRLLENEITQTDLLKTLEPSYRGTKTELEKNVDRILSKLAKQNIVKKVRRILIKKSKAPKLKQRQKKELTWSFTKASLSSSETLMAYAACQMDSDCPPGQICYLLADSCLNYCSTS